MSWWRYAGTHISLLPWDSPGSGEPSVLHVGELCCELCLPQTGPFFHDATKAFPDPSKAFSDLAACVQRLAWAQCFCRLSKTMHPVLLSKVSREAGRVCVGVWVSGSGKRPEVPFRVNLVEMGLEGPSGGSTEPPRAGQAAHLAQPLLLEVAVRTRPSSPGRRLRPHRITRPAELGGTHGDHRVQLLHRPRHGSRRAPESLSRLFWRSARLVLRPLPSPGRPSRSPPALPGPFPASNAARD